MAHVHDKTPFQRATIMTLRETPSCQLIDVERDPGVTSQVSPGRSPNERQQKQKHDSGIGL